MAERFVLVGLLLAWAGCASADPGPTPTAPPAPPAGADCTPSQRLAVGDSCRLRVDSESRQVPLAIRMQPGERYRFELAAGKYWKDWTREYVDPAVGDPGSGLMNLTRRWRKLPGEPWMAMGITVTTCAVPASDARPCPEVSDRLGAAGRALDVVHPTTVAFFANDLPMMNFNNSGAAWVIVTHIGL